MIYISSGFNKSHLILAASEFSSRGLLSKLFIGMYPTNFIVELTKIPFIRKINKLKKLKGRAEKNILDNQVKQFALLEYIHQLSNIIKYKLNSKNPLSKLIISFADNLDIFSHKYYGKLVAKWLKRQKETTGDIYLYRAGFGHQSVPVAKQLGIYTVCDHTAVHPGLFDYMIENKGTYPELIEKHNISSFWEMVGSDLNQADHILVNSNFVKETCIHQGIAPENITVIYLGVDDQFLMHLPKSRQYSTQPEKLRFMFAGKFDKPKGALEIIQTFLNLESTDWQLEIAGYISTDLLNEYPQFFNAENIIAHGFVLRDELPKLMSKCDVLIFPSLAEGSARVIFEAMASGCYVVTTKNAGSIVEHGVHGSIVQPGNNSDLKDNVEYLLANRASISDIGTNNSILVKGSYLQSQYGDQLYKFYKKFHDK